MASEKKVRVRFAPSPTGPLHIGGVRTALYNFLFAKKNNGDFILRIEDTDQNRFVPGAEECILESLNWCGIKFDEGIHIGGPYAPYRQSERKEIYREYAEKLVASGNAYYAFDTPEELDEMRNKLRAAKIASPQYNIVTRMTMKNSLTLPADEVKKKLRSGVPYVIRLKVPRKEEIRLHDEIRGWVVVHSSQMDDKVLLKADGMPTYHLANVVDDYLMKITHVIRGEEWLPSAPTHVLLYKYLGWEDVMPKFAHLPLLLKPEGEGKLSKRDADRLGFPIYAVTWKDPETGEIFLGYRETGYLPGALVNFLALLGWNPGTEQEIFSMEELIQGFSLERVGKSGTKFNINKARWFNQQYLKKLPDEDLLPSLKSALKQKGMNIPNDDYLKRATVLMKERVTFINEIAELGKYLFEEPTNYDESEVKKRWIENGSQMIRNWSDAFDKVKNWKAEEIEKTFQKFCETEGVEHSKVLPLFRLSLTGMRFGPSVMHISALLGKERTVARLRHAASVLGTVTAK